MAKSKTQKEAALNGEVSPLRDSAAQRTDTAANQHFIEVTGARVHNLKNVDVDSAQHCASW